VNDALAERPALVRTLVQKREHLIVVRAEDGDLLAAGIDHARAETRNVVERADVDPVGHVRQAP